MYDCIATQWYEGLWIIYKKLLPTFGPQTFFFLLIRLTKNLVGKVICDYMEDQACMSKPIPTAVALLHKDHFPRQQKPTEINILSYLDV